MKYYKSGEFAKMANVTQRTIRYYDKIGLLKPSEVASNGYRYYTDTDYIKLQKIISLKNLGFSLDDIFSMTIHEDQFSLKSSLQLQKKMIDQRIENLTEMKDAIIKTEEYLKTNQAVDWKQLLNQINITTMENRLINQYKNANNIDIRIKLHEKYSTSATPWFSWLFSKYDLKKSSNVLELGAGNGELWRINNVSEINLFITDISEGMLNDVKDKLVNLSNVSFKCCDMHELPFDDESMDVIIANHVLFYAHDIHQVLKEIKRVLKPNGILYTSTYGKNHMKEINDLIKEYNAKINLSNIPLYDVFGLENGESILSNYFSSVSKLVHKDSLIVSDKKDLIDYILSCHGNQSSYLIDNYETFEAFVCNKMNPNFYITKQAGMFICHK